MKYFTNYNIVQRSGKTFQKFISSMTKKLSKPKTKFITDLLCGILFSNDLILTHIASKVPHPSRLTAVVKRFRRQLADSDTRLWKIVLVRLLWSPKASMQEETFGKKLPVGHKRVEFTPNLNL